MLTSEPVNQTCKTCLHWLRDRKVANFGTCVNSDTFSWAKGQSFEPPGYFGCINWENNNNAFLAKKKKS